MQHKNIHIIKHAKQIKTNTAYRCRPGPRWVATGIYMQHDIIKQKIKHVWIKNLQALKQSKLQTFIHKSSESAY